MTPAGPRFVSDDAVRDWLLQDGAASALLEARRTPGLSLTRTELARALDVPAHLPFALDGLAQREGESALTADVLDSIPFVSVVRGVLLPLSGMARERARALLGVDPGEPLDGASRMELARRFLAKDVGLSAEEKIALLVGDPFGGRKGGLRRDTLLQLAASLQLVSFRQLQERLAQVADVAAVVAEGRPLDPPDPPLTAREVILAARAWPSAGRTDRLLVGRSLLHRMGRAEAYFFCRLMLRKGVPGFDVQREGLAELLAQRFDKACARLGLNRDRRVLDTTRFQPAALTTPPAPAVNEAQGRLF